MKDPIVEEVRKVREAHAARFGYDLDAIFRDIKERERKSGRSFVAFASRNAESRLTQQASEAVSTSQGSSVLKEGPSTSAAGPRVEGGIALGNSA